MKLELKKVRTPLKDHTPALVRSGTKPLDFDSLLTVTVSQTVSKQQN